MKRKTSEALSPQFHGFMASKFETGRHSYFCLLIMRTRGRKRAGKFMQGNTKPDYLAIGFEQIDRDLGFLIEAFADVLRGLGHTELADHLPWTGRPLPPWDPERLPERLGLAYSVAFQLLNMVEENAAGTVRELREEHEGLDAEHGLWGHELARLKTRGLPAGEIAACLPRVRVEPVLTAHPTEAKRLSVLDHHRMLFALLQRSGREPRKTTVDRPVGRIVVELNR